MTQQWVRAPGATSEPSGEQVVVLDAEGTTITTLNDTGGAVWSRLAEPADVDALAAALAASHPDVDPATLQADAAQFLEQLRDAGLVVAADAAG